MNTQFLALISSNVTAVCCVILLILNWYWNNPSGKGKSQ